ncbi:hypothetical protein Q5P01_013949 [Channa striata]|uniref:Uncharacterized protein n=1 Tax=Channa striata TaxID=64152 RepID=A0AA88SKX8_CHASR|nr:hypothetical protein Q5P01_013949 [Channa striata]
MEGIYANDNCGEIDLLNARLIAKTEELNRIQSLSRRKRVPQDVPVVPVTASPVFLVPGKKAQTTADLVVIDSDKEQTFVSGLTQQSAWIGLNDI